MRTIPQFLAAAALSLACVASLGAQNTNVVHGQVISQSAYIDKAHEAEAAQNYNVALAYYQAVLKDDPTRTDLLYSAGEAARLARVYPVAYKFFARMADKDLQKTFPDLNYKFGLVKKSLGKYEEAAQLFNQYASDQPKGQFVAVAKRQVEECTWAKEMVEKPLKVEVEHLDTRVNTIYADLAPVQVGNMLYYTSAFFKTPDSDPITHIYSSDLRSEGKPIAENIDSANVHTAHYATNVENTRMFFNMCKLNEKGEFTCDIWYRKKATNNSWSSPIRLPKEVNAEGFTATQPAVGRNTGGGDVLYFSSNRTGGKGGLDIWAVDISDAGDFKNVRNLKEINTSEDEITPFFYNASQTLYFSSNGQQSLGGFDIFKTVLGKGLKPQNLGSPINSSFDDIYYSFNQSNGRAFFTSNRPGGMCGSEEKDCVCNDIYSYDLKIDVLAKDFFRGTSTEFKNNAIIKLIDVETDEVVGEKQTGNGNSALFTSLALERDYRLITYKDKYTGDTVNFTTRGILEPTIIEKSLYLLPQMKLNVLVVDEFTGKPLNGANLTLRTGGGAILASQTLKGSTFSYSPLTFTTKYFISGTKTTYNTDSSSVMTEGVTSSKFEYFDTLRLRAFSGLPVVLYYDNDHPNPRSKSAVTTYAYGETFFAYMNKQPEFMAAYYRTNRDVSGEGANEISQFFINDVQKGYDKLMEFSALLTNYLGEGNYLEIVLEGYASPLAATDYNRNLTGRRVSCVANHLYTYGGGVLQQYLRDGRLRVRVEPYGETQAQAGISDDGNNRKLSVYSIAASRERRAMIKEINRMATSNADMSGGVYIDFKNFEKGGYASLEKATGTVAQGGDMLTGYVTGEENSGAASASKKSRKGKKGRKAQADDANLGVKYEGSNASSSTSLSSASLSGASLASSATYKGKATWQVVAVDSYTGTILGDADVNMADQTGYSAQAKARRKGNGYEISVRNGGDYRADVSAAGYSKGFATRSAYYSEGESVRYVDTVYLTPFSGLPLPLYFDNDYPNPRSNATTTSSSYSSSYSELYGQRKEFARQYAKLSGSSDAMTTFFESEVKANYEHLSGYAEVIKNYLKAGNQIEVVLEGYASSLAESDYNRNLTSRRVASVVNYFKSHSNLSKYINNGQLKLTIEPFGETSSSASDNAKDASSIFSLEASHDRRVVIKDIRILNNALFGKQ
ncbi:MAG: hypothetical protein RL757_1182 [Bacteroidota bacterium]|jgi:outer membrane protein OmpA-like peptidoglycan-associated protein